MARKSCFEISYEKVSETLIEDNAGKYYYCLCDLFFDFEEVLTSSNSKILIKFSSLPMYKMLPKIFLPVNFTKVVPLLAEYWQMLNATKTEFECISS